jgi:hypothetical protein
MAFVAYHQQKSKKSFLIRFSTAKFDGQIGNPNTNPRNPNKKSLSLDCRPKIFKIRKPKQKSRKP